MLLNNQAQMQSSYVSPFSVRDAMKDDHINNSVNEGERRMKEWEIFDQKRQLEKKNMYKSDLVNQINERKRMETMNRE